MSPIFRSIYFLIIQSYFLSIRIASMFNPKAKKWMDGRKKLFNEIEKVIHPDEKYIWIHAASLGEFEQGRPLIPVLKKIYPQHKIVVTFFSPSGYEMIKPKKIVDHVFYLPADSKRNANYFVELIKPELVIFVKYEFWLNFLYALKSRRIPSILISAIFRQNQVFFKWLGRPYLKALDCFHQIFVQDKNSFELLKLHGAIHCQIAHDTRFDRVLENNLQKKSFPDIEKFINGKKVFIAGSTWPRDEELIADMINSQPVSALKVIIAPHEINSAKIDALISKIKLKSIRYSQIQDVNPAEFDVLVIDNIGMLSSIYQFGDVAYIGGGFSKGIHNVLEAAVESIPIIIGPKYQKFKEAVDLVNEGGIFGIRSKEELNRKFKELFSDESQSKKAGTVCRNYIERNKGGIKVIEEYIAANEPTQR